MARSTVEYYNLQQKRLLKIPRPANAFMLYANENRKKMAEQFPQESNKDISKRLGKSWKCLEESEKIKYFAKAKDIGVEHKKRYPNYVYNPKEARMRKAMREATRDHSLGGIHLQSRGGRSMQSWQAPPEEQLMMNPPSELHPTICGYSSLNGAYMHQMRPYSKTLQTGPSSSWVSNSSFYSQGQSMEPLQHQQGEMWHDYQEINSCATSYIADTQVPSFPSGSADMIPSISRGNCQSEKDTFSNSYQMQASRHVAENVALNVAETKIPTPTVEKKSSNLPLPMHSPVCCENDENSQQYAQIFNGSQNASAVPEQNGFGQGQKESRTEEVQNSPSFQIRSSPQNAPKNLIPCQKMVECPLASSSISNLFNNMELSSLTQIYSEIFKNDFEILDFLNDLAEDEVARPENGCCFTMAELKNLENRCCDSQIYRPDLINSDIGVIPFLESEISILDLTTNKTESDTSVFKRNNNSN